MTTTGPHARGDCLERLTLAFAENFSVSQLEAVTVDAWALTVTGNDPDVWTLIAAAIDMARDADVDEAIVAGATRRVADSARTEVADRQRRAEQTRMEGGIL